MVNQSSRLSMANAKKSLFCVGVFLWAALSMVSAHAKWTRIAETDSDTVYIDKDSAQTMDNRFLILVWVMSDSKSSKGSVPSSMSLKEIRCHDRIRTLQTITFSEPKASGKFLEYTILPGAWEDVKKGTVAEALVGNVCMQGLTELTKTKQEWVTLPYTNPYRKNTFYFVDKPAIKSAVPVRLTWLKERSPGKSSYDLYLMAVNCEKLAYARIETISQDDYSRDVNPEKEPRWMTGFRDGDFDKVFLREVCGF